MSNKDTTIISDLFAGVADMPSKVEPLPPPEEKDEAEVDGPLFPEYLDGVKKLHISQKIHLGIGLFICFGVFIAFRYVAKPNTVQADPWWLIPFFVFSISFSMHHFYQKKDYWKGTAISLIIIHVGLFIINKLYTPLFDWFWYPVLLSLMVGMGIYYYHDPNSTYLKIAASIYGVLNIGIFISWANFQRLIKIPWFVFPILVCGLPLLIWYLRVVYKEYRWFIYALVVLVVLNLICIFVWSFFTSQLTIWPWFLILVVISVIILIGLFFRDRNKKLSFSGDEDLERLTKDEEKDEFVNEKSN